MSVPSLEPLTTNKYTVKDSFNVAFLSKIPVTSWIALTFIHFLLTSLMKKPSKFALITFLKTATLFMVLTKCI